MFEESNVSDDSPAIESQMRSLRLVPPRIDRDRLMFLAGQHSVELPRSKWRLWPTLTVTSWGVCAAIIGVIAARPPQVVVETRLVERIIEVPAEPAPIKTPTMVTPSAVTERSDPNSSINIDRRADFDFRFLEDPGRPLTALASRPSLYRRTAEPTAVASVEPAASAPVPVGARTYSELRRELLGDPRAKFAPTDPLWWF